MTAELTLFNTTLLKCLTKHVKERMRESWHEVLSTTWHCKSVP